ncbi:MAG: PASTA domain-containing protein [Actinomycetota bacterium]
MVDLETQLRRYADQVESHVDRSAHDDRSSGRPSDRSAFTRGGPVLLLAGIAAAAILVVGSLAALLRSDVADEQPLPDVVAAPDNLADDDLATADAEIVVPELVGRSVEEARSLVIEADLDVAVEFVVNADVGINQVIDQDPAAGAVVEAGTAVMLRVSSGAAPVVPSVLGLTRESATSLLQERSYLVTVVTQTSPEDAGTVIGQSPDPGSLLAPGQTVEIAVSGGPEVVPVPDVEGLDVVTAVGLLVDAGFRVDPNQPFESSQSVGFGGVLRTDPGANTLVPPGSVVMVIVSSGAVVPEVTDLFADTAISVLREQGFEVATVFVGVPVGSFQVGRALAQAPVAMSETEPGSIVTITVGEASENPPTTNDGIPIPDVTGLFADTAITLLRELGLEVVVIFERVPAGSFDVGRIVAQRLDADAPGRQIILTVGESVPETATTTTTTMSP